MTGELEEVPLAVAEMDEAEAVQAADYTARHYFSVDARTFLAQLRAGTLTSEDYRVARVLSMISPVRNLLEVRQFRLPGRDEREAFNRYADPLQEVLGCITSVQLRIDGSFKASPATPSQFRFIQNPAPLSNSGLYLWFRQSFHLVYREEEEDWKVKTDSYEYAIENSDRREFFAYHWDPSGKTVIPHLHFGSLVIGAESPVTRKAHVPTGRVPVEDVVWFAIEELGVKPLRYDWNELTSFARKRFMDYKSW